MVKLCFNPYFNGYCTSTGVNCYDDITKINSFNPYFNGYCTSTMITGEFYKHVRCFNPYFNGYCTSTKILIILLFVDIVVLILILMDIALQLVDDNDTVLC